MRLVLASILVASAALGLVACGGRVILVGNPDDEQDAGSNDGGPIGDAVFVDTYILPPYDAQPPIDDAEPGDAIIIIDDGGCLLDVEPCIYPEQCCSGICENGSCGGGPPPSCLPDGYTCNGFPPCCSGPCINGFCGFEDDSSFPEDSGPISCSAPAGNACIDCLAGACCPQLGECESDFQCSQTLACFEGCYTPGQGAACSQKCNQMYPSPLAQSLARCAVGPCPSCD